MLVKICFFTSFSQKSLKGQKKHDNWFKLRQKTCFLSLHPDGGPWIFVSKNVFCRRKSVFFPEICKHIKYVFLPHFFYFFFIFSRVTLTGPRSVAINRLHPCSHWPLFAIAPTHEWIGTGANQTCTWALWICSVQFFLTTSWLMTIAEW